MPSDAVSADLHSSMIMQARFLRAIYYFDLVRMYGGVPLWTKSSIDRSEIMRPRATVDEVYTLITQDMEAALGLPTSWPNAQDKEEPLHTLPKLCWHAFTFSGENRKKH